MEIITLGTSQEEGFFFTFWLYGPRELPQKYKSSESKGHQTNYNNKTTQRNSSVKSFNPEGDVNIGE